MAKTAFQWRRGGFVSDIAIFVLKRDVKLQLTNFRRGGTVWEAN